SLGARVTVFGLVGDDAEAGQLRTALHQQQVQCELLTVPGHPTVTKLRVIGQQQQLIRMDFEESFHHVDDQVLVAAYQRELQRTHVVVLSDYAKGALYRSELLIQLARQQGIPVLVDPKTRDLNQYRGATLITPNKLEFETLVGAWRDENDLVAKARELIAAYDLGGLLITRGKEGMTLIAAGQPAQHYGAKAR